MRFLKIFFFLFNLVIFSSCEYELDNSYVNPIEFPDNKSPEVRLLNVAIDPFYLSIKTFFIPNIEMVTSTEFRAMEVFVDDNLVKELGSYDFFELDPVNYKDGNHILEVIIYSTTGSGSLASAVDAEIISTSYKWEFKIDRTPPAAISLSARIVDGQLLLEWDKPEKNNFAFFEISKPNLDTLKVIDISQTSIIEDAYLGGYGSYRVNLISDFFTVVGLELIVDYDSFEDLDAVLNDKGNVQVSWSRPLFYNNVGLMEIKKQNNPTLYDVSSVNTFEVPYYYPSFNFGQFEIIQFILTGKHEARFRANNSSATSRNINRKVGKGNTFPRYIDLNYNATNKSFYSSSKINSAGYEVYGFVYLYRIDADTHEELAFFDPEAGYNPQKNGFYAISNNGQFLYMIYDDALYDIDPITMTLNNTYPLNELGSGISFNSEIRISDNNILSIGSNIINMNTLQLMSDVNGRISPSGRYIFNFGENDDEFSTLYELIGSDFVLKAEFEKSFGTELFIENEDILILTYPFQDKVIVYNLEANSILHEIPIENLRDFTSRTALTYDDSQKQIMVQSKNYLNIIDYQSGIETKKRLIYGSEGSSITYRIYNDKVFASTGYYIDYLDW